MGFSIRNANEATPADTLFAQTNFFQLLSIFKGPFSDRYKTIFSASFSPIPLITQ
jgi:hypothetical protein